MDEEINSPQTNSSLEKLKKRKRKSETTTKKGVSLKVGKISIIEPTDEIGIHISSGVIGVIKDVRSEMRIDIKGVVTKIDSGCGCKDCYIVIHNTGAVGVARQKSGNKIKNKISF